jgi:hypothetical protein
LTIFVQVVAGVALQNSSDIDPAEFHEFYGFVAIIAVGILYSYRQSSEWVRSNLYVVYGLGGLFLMGLGIRALLVGTG